MVCSVFDLTASSLQAFSLSFKSLGYMEYNDPQNCPGVHEPHSYYCELLYLQISGCSFLSYENDTIGRFTLALGHNKDTLLSFRLCSSVLRVWAKLSGALSVHRRGSKKLFYVQPARMVSAVGTLILMRCAYPGLEATRMCIVQCDDL